MRQGCPLSPYLFLLAVELLAIRVRLCESIRGLYTGPFENKISQYADDTNFPLQPTVDCFNTLVDVLNRFSSISGLKPNYEKCKVLRIGSLKNSRFRIDTEYPFEWTDGSVGDLGVHIPPDLTHIVDVNFNPRSEKARKILQLW